MKKVKSKKKWAFGRQIHHMQFALLPRMHLWKTPPDVGSYQYSRVSKGERLHLGGNTFLICWNVLRGFVGFPFSALKDVQKNKCIP